MSILNSYALVLMFLQTKELASRYERALQDSETAMEKSKNRVEITAEELERVLIQKEGESLRDTGMQGRSPGGGHRTRVIGKAVAKGGMLLKGKNPGNVGAKLGPSFVSLTLILRFNDKKTTFVHGCQLLPICIVRI